MDYTGSGELKSELIHVIRGPSLVILKGNNYTIVLKKKITPPGALLFAGAIKVIFLPGLQAVFLPVRLNNRP
jgi:hypothetical protein